MSVSTRNFSLPADNARLANLCGVMDGNLKIIEEACSVKIERRGGSFTIQGPEPGPERVHDALELLYGRAQEQLEPAEVRLVARQQGEAFVDSPVVAGARARTPNQATYLRRLASCDVTFGEGPAGTGKTYLAIASAVAFLRRREVRRIVLARPAVEAGENLGFLPGDQFEKVHPFLRPLEDAMCDVCGSERCARMLQSGEVEHIPLAYMRGRTLKDSYVILDEAQNTTVTQMKMFLTRLGEGSRCVVTGDCSQVDLPAPTISGLSDILGRVGNSFGCGVVRFGLGDVARHPVVEHILRAYDERPAKR